MSEVKERNIECEPENAPRFWYWVHARGGIAHWKSVNLSDLGKSWSSPVLDKEGNPLQQPHWKADSTPAFTCADPDQIFIVTRKEVRRFRVAVRRGSQGLTWKLTDASSDKLKRELAKINEHRDDDGATYFFDYETQEAVIEVPDKTITLSEWAKQYPELAERAKAGDSQALGY